MRTIMIHHQHISKFGLPSFTQTSHRVFHHFSPRRWSPFFWRKFGVRSVLESGEVLGNKIAGTGKMCDGSLALRGGQPRNVLDCQIECFARSRVFWLVSTMCIYIYIPLYIIIYIYIRIYIYCMCIYIIHFMSMIVIPKMVG